MPLFATAHRDSHATVARLQAALAANQSDEAVRLGEQLANSRCRVRVYADPEAGGGCGGRDRMPDDSMLVVSVTFQTGSGHLSQSVQLAMPRAACVADLKVAALMAFDLPSDIQRCIVDGRLPRDHEVLGELATEASKLLLKVRTYLVTHDSKLWPPDPERLRREKDAVLAERLTRERQSELGTDEGSAGSVEQPPEAAQEQPVDEEPGWCCPECTYRNEPSRPGCNMCGGARPEDYVVPAELLAEEELRQQRLQADFLHRVAQEREQNMRTMITLAQGSIINVANQQQFECPICLNDIGGTDADEDSGGIRLRECGHEVCTDCLRGQALNADSLPVLCPCEDCQQTVTDAELGNLLSPEELARLQRLGLRQAEAIIANAFHCVTPNCEAFVELADEINDFVCEVCKEHNCVTCKASHKGITCKQWQDEMRRRALNDNDARLGLEKLDEMLKSGEAMQCPKCKVFLQKREGCDWLMCSVCKTEICWATKGPRWGPGGQGDTSGGCKCRLIGKCHPQCMNCH